ncbi:hypothetical protein ACWCOP_04900 [Maricaulaceae bacterium MS644]
MPDMIHKRILEDARQIHVLLDWPRKPMEVVSILFETDSGMYIAIPQEDTENGFYESYMYATPAKPSEINDFKSVLGSSRIRSYDGPIKSYGTTVIHPISPETQNIGQKKIEIIMNNNRKLSLISDRNGTYTYTFMLFDN